LRAWLNRRAHIGFDIDDVVQEAYSRLAMLDTVSQIKNPRAYLFQTAHSIILQDLRRSRIVPIGSIHEIGALELEASEPLPDQLVDERMELEQVAAAIESLPYRCREVFLLRKVQGLSQRDVATRLGLSESTIEKHVANGIGKLLDFFANSGKWSARASRARKRDGRPHEKRQ
jgi:RNA polymerase sigma-70 factor (ECF subfamily)